MHEPQHTGNLVRNVEALLGLWVRYSPYAAIKRARLGPLYRLGDSGELWVLLCLLLESAAVAWLMVASPVVGSWPVALVAVLAGWRALDVGIFQMRTLMLDRRSPLQGVARSFLLALLNLVELGLITIILLYSIGFPVNPDGFREGAQVATFQNDLSVEDAASPWTGPLLTTLMGIALLVAVGTVGLVVGKLADTFYIPEVRRPCDDADDSAGMGGAQDSDADQTP